MNTRLTCAACVGALLVVMAGCASGESPSSTPSASSSTASPAGSVCTPGMDQTCNDDPQISSLHGTCRPDGTCDCGPGFAKNEATGRCK